MRLGVVADISNLYYCTRKTHNKKVNYREIIAFAKEWGTIEYAVAYGASIGDQADKFQATLAEMGFETRFKEPKLIRKARKYKADWDVGIAIDTLKHADVFDTLILCTADGDMAPLVTRLQEMGITVWIIGAGISHELTEVANETFEIIDRFLEKR
jgi:uncharacterized LabA/DUF88 family protein